MIDEKLPMRECDLILKGGITSGVVYPGVVSELSETYRFRNIGGTSAGAIAAAATAAAEVGRQTGKGGFKGLTALPSWLGKTGASGKTRLNDLFSPNAPTERLHRVLTAPIGNADPPLWNMAHAAVQAFPVPFWFGLAPGLFLSLLALVEGTGLLALLSFLAGLVLATIGALGTVVYRLYRTSSRALKNNYFGLTTGHAQGVSATSLALTDWLAEFLDDLAGLQERDKPLTFGDLKAQGVNLHMITTCVTHGRPYNLPFQEVKPGKPGRFYMKKEDIHAFFPSKVARWLEAQGHNTDNVVSDEAGTYIKLPPADDLPVVFATRLSLSFPLLISAVPLYAVDYTRRREEDRVLERCWFTDGGVSSNFPVHLFDAPLPTRPTFAVNLRPHHVDYGPGSDAYRRNKGVWMPNRNGGGSLTWWHRFEREGGVGSLLAFLKVMVETGLSWQDTLLAGAPGHRDRIVHIGLSPEEGGLNLNMEQATLDALFERGRAAGAELVSRFADGEHELNWDNHRWIRYRTLMTALEEMHGKLEHAYHLEREGERTYEELLDA